MAVKESVVEKLSHAGRAAYDVLNEKHAKERRKLWNVTSGRVVGKVLSTPQNAFDINNRGDPKYGHDDWFPQGLCSLISKTEEYCDILSLSPPDGLFLKKMKDALYELHEKVTLGRIRVRMLFGHVIGMSVDCDALMREMTDHLPKESTKIQLWIGAWRKNTTWNHSKIIAVDGRYLHTGGHNLWDKHYLRTKPVHDVSIELEGKIAIDAHLYANQQWECIENDDNAFFMSCKLPCKAFALSAFVSVCEFPPGRAPIYPVPYGKGKSGPILHAVDHNPKQFLLRRNIMMKEGISRRKSRITERMTRRKTQIDRKLMRLHDLHKSSQNIRNVLSILFKKEDISEDSVDGSEEEDAMVPIISIGRTGAMTSGRESNRPSDAAILALFDSAKTSIRLAVQDFGPFCFPGTKTALPGLSWPKPYLRALGRAIFERDVDVEIILSNPCSIPHSLTMLEGMYGNGWECNDVACEIIKAIKTQFKKACDDMLRAAVEDKLRVCFIRSAQGTRYNDGMTIGLHAKHFIIDGQCCYIGSQNLYCCDLAEWGVVIDDSVAVKKIMRDYWKPMWKVSYTGEDCDVRTVMDGLHINRDGGNPNHVTTESSRKEIEHAKQVSYKAGYMARQSKNCMFLESSSLEESMSEEDSISSDGGSESSSAPEAKQNDSQITKNEVKYDSTNNSGKNKSVMHPMILKEEECGVDLARKETDNTDSSSNINAKEFGAYEDNTIPKANNYDDKIYSTNNNSDHHNNSNVKEFGAYEDNKIRNANNYDDKIYSKNNNNDDQNNSNAKEFGAYEDNKIPKANNYDDQIYSKNNDSDHQNNSNAKEFGAYEDKKISKANNYDDKVYSKNNNNDDQNNSNAKEFCAYEDNKIRNANNYDDTIYSKNNNNDDQNNSNAKEFGAYEDNKISKANNYDDQMYSKNNNSDDQNNKNLMKPKHDDSDNNIQACLDVHNEFLKETKKIKACLDVHNEFLKERKKIERYGSSSIISSQKLKNLKQQKRYMEQQNGRNIVLPYKISINKSSNNRNSSSVRNTCLDSNSNVKKCCDDEDNKILKANNNRDDKTYSRNKTRDDRNNKQTIKSKHDDYDKNIQACLDLHDEFVKETKKMEH